MSRRVTGGAQVPAASRLEHVLRVGYKSKTVGSADEDNSFVDYYATGFIPMLAVRVADGAKIFVAKAGIRSVTWALENIRGSAYADFPWTIEFMDVTKEPWRAFGTCTYKRGEDDLSDDSGWTFRLLSDPPDKIVFQKGGKFNGGTKESDTLTILGVHRP